MSLLFSRRCEYALQAVSYLLLQPKGKMISTNTMTKALKIPYHFLAKILQELTYKKLLISQKGPYGGFALALPPRRITLFRIVKAIDGDDFTSRCVMGLSHCSGKNPCPVHRQWGKIRKRIHAMLASKNIAEMATVLK